MIRRTFIDRAAEQVVDTENVALADERERAVHMESQAFGLQAAMFSCLSLALVLAVFGHIGAPLAFIAAMILPALAAGWHGRRRGVDEWELMSRGRAGKLLAWTSFYSLLVVGAAAAML